MRPWKATFWPAARGAFKAAAFSADFANVAEISALAEQTNEFLGGINCLVNNAGVTLTKPFLKTTQEQFDLLFAINLRAQFFLTQKIVAHMLNNGGGVVCNISSIHGLHGAPQYSLYSATKGAIIAYTRSLAVELAHKGIRVNGIAPGWITVENYARAIPDYDPHAERREAARLIPAGRPGKPIDVARLAAYLCSDDASFIVGQTIVVDGGSAALLSLKSDSRAETDSRWGTGYLPDL